MWCCACNGSCNHVGNHSYCEAHGGKPVPIAYTTTGTSFTWLPTRPDPVLPLDGRWHRWAGLRLAIRLDDGGWAQRKVGWFRWLLRWGGEPVRIKEAI